MSGGSNASNPANATPVYLGGGSFANVTASQYAQIKVGSGVFSGLSVNTVGTTSAAAFYDGISQTATMTIAAPGVVTVGASPAPGSAVVFETTGALPTGLTAGVPVYVSITSWTATTFKLSDTKAHALAGTNLITTSGSQSGVHTAWDVSNPIGTWSTTAQDNLPLGTNGVLFTAGLIAFTSDGGGAANLTVMYR